MNDKYKELREAVERATQGGWKVQRPNAGPRGYEVASGGGLDQVFDYISKRNAEYVAAAIPSTIRALLAERDALEELKLKFAALYHSANMLMLDIGAHGRIDTDQDTVVDLMSVLRGIDGGQYDEGFLIAAKRQEVGNE